MWPSHKPNTQLEVKQEVQGSCTHSRLLYSITEITVKIGLPSVNIFQGLDLCDRLDLTRDLTSQPVCIIYREVSLATQPQVSINIMHTESFSHRLHVIHCVLKAPTQVFLACVESIHWCTL